MGSSLQDQLIGAGLIDKKKANKLKAEQSKQQRHKRKTGKPGTTAPAAHTQQTRAAAEKDRELNRRRQERKERKAIAAQIAQILDKHSVPLEESNDVAFNFVDQGKVKKIYLNKEIQQRVIDGRLAVVKAKRHYHLIPADLLEKLRQRDPGCVILHNDSKSKSDSEADAYPEHQIPDDLMW